MNSGQLEGVPTEQVVAWARHGISPTSQRLADEAERLIDLLAWLDEQIAGPYAADDRDARVRVNTLKEVRAHLTNPQD